MKIPHCYRGWNVYLNGVRINGIGSVGLPIITGDGEFKNRSIVLKFFTASEQFFHLLTAPLGSKIVVKSASQSKNTETGLYDQDSECITGTIQSR